MLTFGCQQNQQIHIDVKFRGCIVFWEKLPRPFCATGVGSDPKKKLYLSISGAPLAKFSLKVNQERRFQGALSDDGKASVVLDAATTDGLLEIDLEDPHHERAFSADIAPQNPFVNAVAVRDQLKKQPRSEWPRLVEQLLTNFDATTRSFAAGERSYLLGQLGSIMELVARDISDDKFRPELRELAIRVLHRAITEAHDVGLLSVEAVSLRRLSYIYTKAVIQDRQNAEAALRELTDPIHKKAFSNEPDAATFVHFKISRIHEDLGNIGESLIAIRKILPLLSSEGLKDSEKVIYLLQYSLLSQYANNIEDALQGSRQALQILKDGKSFSACDLLQNYNSIGWVHTLAQQAGRTDVTPVELLEQAASYRAKCAIENSEMAADNGTLVMLNLAQANLLLAKRATDPAVRQHAVAEVERLLREASAVPTPRSDDYLDIPDLAGQLSLLHGDGDAALLHFRRLRQLTSTRVLNPFYRWQALIGEADALTLLNRRSQALTIYGEAEQVLLQLTNGLPKLGQRQLFVAQFEAGISRHLALLAADPATKKELLLAIRRARMLALHAYLQPARSGSAAEDLQKLLARYHDLHTQHDAAAHELHDAPLVERAGVAAKMQKLEDALRDVIDAIYRGPADASRTSATTDFRPPREGELLLACYPLPRSAAVVEWMCVAADSQDHYLHRVRGFADAEKTALLSALQKPLLRAKRLQILAYGEMRNVVWEQALFQGRPLADRVAVSYGLDVHPSTVPSTSRRALVVLNPEQDLSGAHRIEQSLVSRIQASGWKLELFRGAAQHGRHLFGFLRGGLFDSVRPAVAPPVLDLLPDASLFVYYGHAESSRQGGWDSHLRFADEGRIAARDIMALRITPQRVLLLGCETAVSDPSAPVDELGLAQAFLLRGSQEVLATTRKVPDAFAEKLLEELEHRGALDRIPPPLAETLGQALQTLRRGTPHADWDAFRVYQP